METSFHKGVETFTSIEAVKFMEDDIAFIEDLFQKIIPISKIERMEVMGK